MQPRDFWNISGDYESGEFWVLEGTDLLGRFVKVWYKPQPGPRATWQPYGSTLPEWSK